ncbi:MAG: hypothetical protein KGI08_11300 [Thaumarchaeota archaeon]|nr:hypothetical protein [Nitrososphaerota archaeon]
MDRFWPQELPDGLTQFCNYTNLTYDEILRLDIEDLQIKLENWVMELADRGLRRSSVLAHLNGVEKFLDINRKLFYRKPLPAYGKYANDTIYEAMKYWGERDGARFSLVQEGQPHNTIIKWVKEDSGSQNENGYYYGDQQETVLSRSHLVIATAMDNGIPIHLQQ